MAPAIADVRVLTFDMFGTVLDLTGTLLPGLRRFLARIGSQVDARRFWDDWRARQRLQQHQDTILMLGHDGYLDSAGRALVHTLRRHRVPHGNDDVVEMMALFADLRAFDDARDGLARLGQHYRLVALSNGNARLVERLAGRIPDVEFHACLSADRVGRFKPHPSVYRMAALELDCEPGEMMMVASHAFDILGARACGYRGAYVNRYRLPYEVSPLLPDLEVSDFNELAGQLVPG
ncbi:MAG: haloacid dehalogenase type II [Bryobacterales bacterium]|nr:haloacid dehalogenase type II [Bryobacterales bacterium]